MVELLVLQDSRNSIFQFEEVSKLKNFSTFTPFSRLFRAFCIFFESKTSFGNFSKLKDWFSRLTICLPTVRNIVRLFKRQKHITWRLHQTQAWSWKNSKKLRQLSTRGIRWLSKLKSLHLDTGPNSNLEGCEFSEFKNVVQIHCFNLFSSFFQSQLVSLKTFPPCLLAISLNYILKSSQFIDCTVLTGGLTSSIGMWFIFYVFWAVKFFESNFRRNVSHLTLREAQPELPRSIFNPHWAKRVLQWFTLVGPFFPGYLILSFLCEIQLYDIGMGTAKSNTLLRICKWFPREPVQVNTILSPKRRSPCGRWGSSSRYLDTNPNTKNKGTQMTTNTLKNRLKANVVEECLLLRGRD